MLHYAREDTHYLLYMFDRLVNQLVEQGNEFNNLLLATYERSKGRMWREKGQGRGGDKSGMKGKR